MPQASLAAATHAVLDSAHIGDIQGALGTIAQHDVQPRLTFGHRLRTLLAILGPGLIVMVGDNDAGAFGTYTQAGQNYGTSLLWTLLLLVPVLYVNQEMVLRLGAVTGVGHARLIFERFGRFWGAFSVIDLFLLNALTIVTEFIGISLGLDYLGLSRFWGVSVSALLIVLAASTGNFRRFERFALFLVFGSLLLVPVFLIIPPPVGQLAHDFFIPQLPKGGKLSDVMLLIIAIVGTTVAPWQLFFQQSYVVDKRITPRFIRYERLDLWLGILLVVVGAVAMMGFTAATFSGRPEFGQFTDAGAVAAGMEKYFGRTPGVLFALALIDACIIGASAVSLSTAYALGDVLSIRHSLHRKPTEAVAFYAFFFGLIALAAALVLTPGVPLGLLTNLVQTLAGVLLPSATVFLLLLCNDRAVLGPWVNGRAINVFTTTIIAILVLMSVILTASVLFPDISEPQIVGVLVCGTLIAIALTISVRVYERARRGSVEEDGLPDPTPRSLWRMPPLHLLPPARLTLMNRVWMGVLRAYLVVAASLLLLKLVQMATPPASAAEAETGTVPASEDWSLHWQATDITQYHPAFHSPYDGPNSLAPANSTRETIDTTLFAGARLWHGGAVYFNPEIDQGYGLSGTLGVAGFTSGGAYKVGDDHPYYRMPRLFVRQEIDLGGPDDPESPGANQLAGPQSADSVTLTAGKFGAVDVFDTNRYAHDPRADFLNWSIVDSGAYDYAADAWGYTYGAAAEWTQSWWTLRGGVFALSRVPNQRELDRSFKQFELVTELEGRQSWLGRPGKLKLLAFNNRGRMGGYDAAVDRALQTGSGPNTALVRHMASRPGVALNLEQELTTDLGAFARVSVNDGTKEAYEFTDINRSVTAGLSMAGTRWNRSQDTIGLAGVANGLSTAARRYFAAGGLGILIGDGELPHYGVEKIVETYYSAHLLEELTLSADFQYVVNPAYSRDRGPASIFGFRVHAEL